jgi:branched-chain amino acid transport system permease protein
VQIWLNYFVQILIYSGFAVSLNLLLGYAGQVSVAHAAFGAIGGYTMAYMAADHGWSFLPGVLLGTFFALIAGFVLALPAMKLSVEYLILLTLAVAFVILGVLSSFPQLGGTYGLINLPKASIFGIQMNRPGDWVIPCLVMLVIIFAICHRMGESAYGRVLKGIREDPMATQALGKNVFLVKLTVFGLASALAGLAGGFYAGWLRLATPGVYGFPFALTLFAIVIFGGMANLWGSILGSIIVVLLEPILRDLVNLEAATASVVQLIIYGATLALLMLLRPQGAIPEGSHPLRRLRFAVAGDEGSFGSRLRHGPIDARREMLHDDDWEPEFTGATSGASIGLSVVERHTRWEQAPVVLEARNISKRFGGVIAASELDIDLRAGTITALVGPNGAGKTTVFNLLTGFIPPDSGSVKLNGQELVGLTSDRIARMGLVRSFQDVRLIGRISCAANVMMAVQEQSGEHFWKLYFGGRAASRSEVETREKAMEWLGFVGMADFADTPAGALSYGQSKLVSLARLLATEAPVLLLDEPASGIDTRWVETTLQMVEAVRDQGRTVCIVEHNLHVVGRLSDHTYFMELGRITAAGTIDELTRLERLAEAYFGT